MRHEYESSKIQSWKWPEFFNRQIVKIRGGKVNNLWIQGNLQAMTIFLMGNTLGSKVYTWVIYYFKTQRNN